MLKVCRIALVALALLSTTFVSTPAIAGMVATPKAAEAGKVDKDLAILKAAAAKAGMSGASVEVALTLLTPEARTVAVAHLMVAESAGNALGIVAILAGVVVVGVIVLSELLWNHGYLTNYLP
ncbi:MAG: hypothetical protein K8T20_13720 [Planctomycetes bacterium]|nr:hypothetical protein [Planctomycetota bacterium]